jgi:DNA-binding NtrC family response regulator
VFLEALELIQRIARFDVPVVIEGETGTGKELAARAIHYGSPRRDAAFVPINCGAIPDSLIESELFGHERGAFTDARASLEGLVEVADRGTLFLDEVDSLSPHAQVTLLRFLQDHRYRRIGGRADRESDVRIVAASNRNLEALAEAGTFRTDLLFRLKLLHVQLPPLRSRPGDATLLAHHFVEMLNARYRPEHKRVTPALATWLEVQPWRGNVRELENFIHRRHLFTEHDDIDPPDVDASRVETGLDEPAATTVNLNYRSAKAAALAEFDRAYLRSLLARTSGNITAAAHLASKERRALGRMIRKYGLRPDLFKKKA